MPKRVDVVLYFDMEWDVARKCLASALPEGLEAFLLTEVPPNYNEQTKIAAMSRDEGLWFFLLQSNEAFPIFSEVNDWKAFNTLAKQCVDMYLMPRDASRLRENLQQNEPNVQSEQDLRLLREFHNMGLVGCSEPYRESIRLTARLARFDVPVLIKGETGTGKELFARALHYRGNRRDAPFVPVNCGALTDGLLESALFGHARGAFTGAYRDVKGLVSQANGGTLFFDEVHTLSPRAQITLLRFLQDQEFRSVGSEKLQSADVRIIAATNTNLRKLIEKGNFREDLFYRLEVASLMLPALRERPEDIPLLAKHSLSRLSRRYNYGKRCFDPSALEWMTAQSWKGNIRELENFICRAFLHSDRTDIPVSALTGSSREIEFSSARDTLYFNEARKRVLCEFEASYLRRMLEKTCGNVTEAARMSGKDRRVFGRLMKKHGIDRREYI